ncbi:type III secretion system inner rod subunit SctI [Burkholderia dolosa]|uniref:type III secretion system inner rod subunit SctI n=1 Tax=Burkholderia dolosa TaxID=152500 RepID=UPI00158FFE4A|nr:type III secretion system inner rod subunit SctI [Burkholderia dolosa]MBR8458386.1 type III secretion system inner rod subunit SctI [Burkholderia dolosa]
MHITHLTLTPQQPDLASVSSSASPATLDTLLARAVTEANAHASAAIDDIAARLASPKKLSDPEQLAQLQTRLSDYGIDISLISNFAHKATSMVETLIKAQ